MVTAVVPARRWGADLVGSHRVAGRAVRGRPAASALYRVARSAQMVSRTPCAPGSSGISRTPRAGSFHSAVAREASRPWGRERSTIPYVVSVSTAEPGCRPGHSRTEPPAGGELRPVQQHAHYASANRPDELSDLVIEGQVLAHERGQHELGDFHELDCLAEHVQWLPTSGCGGEGRRRGGTAPPGLHPATSDGACSGGRETTVRAPRSGAAHLSRASG